MQKLPHHYSVVATAEGQGDVDLASDSLASIATSAPAEFGGPGDLWSPETLLTGSVATCFILSFRAIARASELPWISLKCRCRGTLERADGTTKFTEFLVDASLEVPQGTNEDRANRILQKAEKSCLVTNSLSGETHLNAVVRVAP